MLVRPITKDTVLCMSLAGRPSNVGTRFHNFLYAELDLDFVYKMECGGPPRHSRSNLLYGSDRRRVEATRRGR